MEDDLKKNGRRPKKKGKTNKELFWDTEFLHAAVSYQKNSLGSTGQVYIYLFKTSTYYSNQIGSVVGGI